MLSEHFTLRDGACLLAATLVSLAFASCGDDTERGSPDSKTHSVEPVEEKPVAQPPKQAGDEGLDLSRERAKPPGQAEPRPSPRLSRRQRLIERELANQRRPGTNTGTRLSPRLRELQERAHREGRGQGERSTYTPQQRRLIELYRRRHDGRLPGQ